MFMGRRKCFHIYSLSRHTATLASVSGDEGEEVTSPFIIVDAPGHMKGALTTWTYRFSLGDVVSNKWSHVTPKEAFQ